MIKYCQQCKILRPKRLFKGSICNFQMSKYVKKGYMEMGEQLYLDSNIKYCDLKDFLKAQFVIFRCQNM